MNYYTKCERIKNDPSNRCAQMINKENQQTQCKRCTEFSTLPADASKLEKNRASTTHCFQHAKLYRGRGKSQYAYCGSKKLENCHKPICQWNDKTNRCAQYQVTYSLESLPQHFPKMLPLGGSGTYQLFDGTRKGSFILGTGYEVSYQGFQDNDAKFSNIESVDKVVVYRQHVPLDKIQWSVKFPDYRPITFTSPGVILKNINLNPENWADPENIDERINKKDRLSPKAEMLLHEKLVIEKGLDEAIKEIKGKKQKMRLSYMGRIRYDDNGYPLNPIGRTGLRGRGVLGNWGPNHAVDPVVAQVTDNKIKFALVKRRDNDTWAIPGGMVEPGTSINDTLLFEFAQETLNIQKYDNETDKEYKDRLLKHDFVGEIKKLKGHTVYEGIVDDPRNTDNAWMETVVKLTVVPEKLGDKKIELKAGDDAAKATWITYNKSENNLSYESKSKGTQSVEFSDMFASHGTFIQMCIEKIGELIKSGKIQGPTSMSGGGRNRRAITQKRTLARRRSFDDDDY